MKFCLNFRLRTYNSRHEIKHNLKDAALLICRPIKHTWHGSTPRPLNALLTLISLLLLLYNQLLCYDSYKCNQWTHQNQRLLTNRFAQTTMLKNNQLLVSLEYFTKQLLVVNKHFTNCDHFLSLDYGRVSVKTETERSTVRLTTTERTVILIFGVEGSVRFGSRALPDIAERPRASPTPPTLISGVIIIILFLFLAQ